MRSLLASLLMCSVFVARQAPAAYGWFGVGASYILVDLGAGQVSYDLTGSGTFNGANLGSFQLGVDTLVLDGFQNYTYENDSGFGADNVWYGALGYRVYLQSEVTPPSFSILGHDIGEFEDYPVISHPSQPVNPGDNLHQETNAGIDLLSSLSPGLYYFDAYTFAYVDWGGGLPDQINDTIFQNNSGSNHRASFEVTAAPLAGSVPEPTSAALLILGAAGLRHLATRRRRQG